MSIENVAGSRPHGKHGHGKNKTPTYQAWLSMKARCYIPSATGYERYGGRGITVCDRWRNSFSAFLEDVGERPEGRCGKVSLYSLERIDNNGNYEPQNCKWAVRSVQMYNRRKWKFLDGPTRRQELHELRGLRKLLKEKIEEKITSLASDFGELEAYRKLIASLGS